MANTVSTAGSADNVTYIDRQIIVSKPKSMTAYDTTYHADLITTYTSAGKPAAGTGHP